MNGGEEIPGELVVTGCDAAEILEPAEAALDDVASLVGPPIEAMADDAVCFVGNDRPGPALGDLGAQSVAVVAFVGDERPHAGCLRENSRRSSNVGVLAGRQVQNDGAAVWIAQGMDLRRASAARTADGLRVLPPFPPEAQR